MELQEDQQRAVRLRSEAAELAEAERMRAEAVEASTTLVRENLREYLARNPGATYQSWIAALHPENVELDPRLLLRNNPWLVVWDEAGTVQKVKEIRCFHGVLAVFSFMWAGLCIYMHNSTGHIVLHTTRIMGGATTLSVLLSLIQAAIFVTTFYSLRHEAWPLHVYKVNVGQLLVQTITTITGLTSFIFHEHGLSILHCLNEATCITSLKGQGVDKDVLEWRELTGGRLLGGPFSVIDIVVKRDGIVTRLSNSGQPTDGLSIRSAMPLQVSFTAADTFVVYMTLIVYGLALTTTCLYVCAYRCMGQPTRGRWIPPWLTFKRMEIVGCFLCFQLIFLNMWGFALHKDSLFVAPAFIGVATQLALLSKLWTTLGQRRPADGPFNQWQKRTVTTHGVGAAVAFTYMTGLSLSFLLCSRAGTWPATLRNEGKSIFTFGAFLHLILSVGYGTSIWGSLYLARIRTASRPQDVEAVHRVVARHEEDGSALPATTSQTTPPLAPSPPATASTLAEEANECIVCMEDPRDTVLVPCGHIALCNTCARNIMASRRPMCPVCRVVVGDVCRVFLS